MQQRSLDALSETKEIPAKETILKEAERLTNQDRRATYGHPLDNFTRTANLFNAQFAHKLKEPFTAEDIEIAMVLVKLARQAHKPQRDNLVDACGYLNLVDMTERERERRSSER